MEAFFYRWVARPASVALGKPVTFVATLLASIVYTVTPAWHTDYIMNTMGAYTGIVGILLLLLLQATTNWNEVENHKRDVAMHLKLDEALRAIPAAREVLIAAEEKTADEIAAMKDAVL